MWKIKPDLYFPKYTLVLAKQQKTEKKKKKKNPRFQQLNVHTKLGCATFKVEGVIKLKGLPWEDGGMNGIINKKSR